MMDKKNAKAPQKELYLGDAPNQKKHKGKNLILFFIKGFLVLALALLPGVLVILKTDPYLFLGLQQNPRIYVPNERFQIPGIAKFAEYDMVILGSSMVENFSDKYVSEKLKAKAIRLPINASYVTEQRDVLDIAEKTHKVKTVLWGIDYRSVDIRNGDIYLKNVKFPTYMYDKSRLNDWKYIINHNNFFWGLKEYQMRRTGVNPYNYLVTSLEDLNTWNWKRFGKDLITADYRELYMGKKSLYDKINNLPVSEAQNTIDKTVVSALKEYPDTQFIFFFPPKSILWFKLMDQKGILEKKLDVLTYFVDQVSAYPNCDVYNFQNQSEITENLDLYLDITHYSNKGNILMTDAIAEKRLKTDPESFRKDCSALLNRVRSAEINQLADSILK